MLIEHGGVRLLTDPVLRRRILHIRRHGPVPKTPASIDAVLLSHLHFDHLDLPSLRKVGTEVRVIAPRGAGAFLRRAGLVGVDELRAGESTAVESVTVTATPAEHDHRRRPLGPTAQPLGFVSRTPERSVYFAGDTDVFAGMQEIGPVDLALLPIAGWGPKVPGRASQPEQRRARRGPDPPTGGGPDPLGHASFGSQGALVLRPTTCLFRSHGRGRSGGGGAGAGARAIVRAVGTTASQRMLAGAGSRVSSRR